MKKRSPLPISIERLTEEFQKPELRDSYPNFYDLKTPIDRILWVLWVLKEQFRIMEYAPADVISDILIDGMGHRLSPLSVTKALARASQDKYNSKLLNDETVYKIMQLGIDYLQSLNRDDTLLVHRIGGTKPRTDKKFLASIIKESKSEIKIVDPYYGSKTLDNFEKIHFGKPIKLLTAHLGRGERPSNFQQDWNDFKTEYNNVEIKTYNNPAELHDRYILTKNSIIFLGHGIKDFGGKESFVIVFQGKAGKNILSDLTKQFDSRWRNSTPI